METACPSFSTSFFSCWAFFKASTPSLALNSPFTQSTSSSPYMTSSMMPVVRAVCHENKEESICFHTGTPFCPDFTKLSYSTRALFTSSAKMGRLLEMARKNIWGPIAREGISRAICWILMCRPLNCCLAAGSSGGTVCVASAVASSCFNRDSNSAICFSSASIPAMFSLWSRFGEAFCPTLRNSSICSVSPAMAVRNLWA